MTEENLFIHLPVDLIFVKTKKFNICVADNNANTVVVVDQNGGFRFRYSPWEYFYPIEIVTDKSDPDIRL